MFINIPTYAQISSVKLMLETCQSDFNINFTLHICAYVGIIINIKFMLVFIFILKIGIYHFELYTMHPFTIYV
jgi:hypothetical protein